MVLIKANWLIYKVLQESPQVVFFYLSKPENCLDTVQALEWAGLWIFGQDIKITLWRIYKMSWSTYDSWTWDLQRK